MPAEEQSQHFFYDEFLYYMATKCLLKCSPGIIVMNVGLLGQALRGGRGHYKGSYFHSNPPWLETSLRLVLGGVVPHWREQSYITSVIQRSMELFTNTELTGMHLICGLAEGNARAAERLYRERYLQTDKPDCQLFTKTHFTPNDSESVAIFPIHSDSG
ncbi:hypothetical protein TNCV_369351 [Trichonephila clavipes]|nr:hypothetical protein TNCV_369351 [Trichonephila clavipes]